MAWARPAIDWLTSTGSLPAPIDSSGIGTLVPYAKARCRIRNGRSWPRYCWGLSSREGSPTSPSGPTSRPNLCSAARSSSGFCLRPGRATEFIDGNHAVVVEVAAAEFREFRFDVGRGRKRCAGRTRGLISVRGRRAEFEEAFGDRPGTVGIDVTRDRCGRLRDGGRRARALAFGTKSGLKTLILILDSGPSPFRSVTYTVLLDESTAIALANVSWGPFDRTCGSAGIRIHTGVPCRPVLFFGTRDPGAVQRQLAGAVKQKFTEKGDPEPLSPKTVPVAERRRRSFQKGFRRRRSSGSG